MNEEPVFPKELHRLRPTPVAAKPKAKAPKHDKTSRDNREDRGERQMKNTHNAQTFPHRK
jgi:hypothetical protein